MSSTSTPTRRSSPSLDMPGVVAIPVAARPSLPVVSDGAEVGSPTDERTRRAWGRSRQAAAMRAVDEAVRTAERSYHELLERRDACTRAAAADRAILRSAGYLPA